MKRINYIFVLLTLVFITNSCEENGIFFPPSDNEGVFEVTIDGETFTTTQANFVTDNSDIVITAIKTETNEIFTLAVESFDTRNFSFEGINNVATYIQNDPVSAGIWTTFSETSSRGNITFTDINFVDNTVSGTFSFIGKNSVTNSSKAFSNGTFTNIPLSNQPVSADSFSAKVDGVDFVDISLFATPITIGTTNLISISANSSLSETINFNLNADIIPGEYDFGSVFTQTFPTGQYSTSVTDTYVADGKLIITSHDTTAKKIAGTFSFEAIDILSSAVVHTITEGEFNVSY